jgi:predicted DCC family thiol-disulfide oxidoreductase YuxK
LTIAHGPQVTVFYDGACPLCAKEISFYRQRDPSGALHFVDISLEDSLNVLATHGLSFDAAMQELHVVRDGKLFKGVDAFTQIWDALPAFKWLAAASRFKPFQALLKFAYGRFATHRAAVSKWAVRLLR